LDSNKILPILDLKVFAPRYIENAADADSADLIRKVTAGLDTKEAFIFGGSVAGQMSLRLTGTCGLFNKQGALKARALSYFAGTYTYIYPIQTSSSYRIEIDRTKFEQAIMTIVKSQNGQITSSQINEALKNTPAVRITKKDGMGSNGDS